MSRAAPRERNESRMTPILPSNSTPGRCASPSGPTSAAPSPASGIARRRSCAPPSRRRSRARARRRCSRCCRTRTGSATGASAGRAATTPPVTTSRTSPHSLHGVGWQRPWRIVSSSAIELVLGLEHAGDADWPFAVRGAPVLHPGAGVVLGATAVHQHRRGRAAGGPGLSSLLRQAGAQPAARRGRGPLGDRRHQAADPQGRAAGHRRRPRPSRLRPLLRRLARPGADPRRALLPAAGRRSCPISSSTRRRSATTSASSRSATSTTRSTWPSRRRTAWWRWRRGRRSRRRCGSTSPSSRARSGPRRGKRRVSPIAITVNASSASPRWRRAPPRGRAAARRAPRR